ncbi:protein of unknown function [Pseudomonas mediterranea]
MRGRDDLYQTLLWRVDSSVASGFICDEGIYLWRGDLSPLGCEAAPSDSDSNWTTPSGRL